MIPEEVKEESLEAQRRTIRKMRGAETPYTTSVEGKKLVILPKVFPPAEDSVLLVKRMEIGKGDLVLDACSGCGICSIFAADKAEKVIATDISEYAIRNIEENAKLHSLDDKIEAVQTDIFPNSKIKFDVILINPPYTDKGAKDVVEKAIWDERHGTVTKFLKGAKNFLKGDGRIYLSWANFADPDLIESLAEKYGYEIKRIGKVAKDRRAYFVYELRPS